MKPETAFHASAALISMAAWIICLTCMIRDWPENQRHYLILEIVNTSMIIVNLCTLIIAL